MRVVSLVASLVLTASCGGDPAVALFELPGTGEDYYALPFPNDLRLDADGTISLDGHVVPNALTEEYLDAIEESVVGFSTNPVGYFRFDGAIDVGSLPQTPEESVDADASVYLVGVDPNSSHFGVRIPTRFRFTESAGSVIGDNWLAVQTFPGFVLEEGRTYAFVVTRRLHSDGESVLRDAEFKELVSSSGAGTGSYPLLFSYLDADGDDSKSDVVSAAVFTTQEATALLVAARAVVHEQAPPSARDIEFITSNSSYAQYEGLYDAPNFQSGEPPYRREGGSIEVDGDGRPVIERSEELRFALTVPLGDPPEGGWPVVLYAHGTSGSYTSFVTGGTARLLADVGIAGLSMDQVLHGPRDPTSSSAELNFFNLLNPSSARDNTLQGAIDLFSLARLAEGFDYNDEGESRHVLLDGDSMMFFGHSQGGITGTPFLGVESNVKGAILSGSGGLISLGLLNKTEPIDITALLSTIIRDEPLDEFNPVLQLLQTYLDRADGANYARYIIREPRPGTAPKDVFLGLGFTDRFTPVPTIEALAVALGVDMVEPVIEPITGFELGPGVVQTAPVVNNVGQATGVVLQYDEEPGSDGHFVLFDIEAAREQTAEFLRSLAYDGDATLIAP